MKLRRERMRVLREMWKMMVAAGAAHARWEKEMSDNVFRSKKRVFLLAALGAVTALLSLALASDLPKMLGGKEAYTPSFYTPTTFFISAIIGLCAGLITGAIGAGGGFIITPALMSAGVKGILAVGTDLFHIFAKAIMGTVVHKKLGNVSVSLAIAFLVGSVGGATVGGLINRTLYETNPVLSDTFISLVYVLLLGFLGIYSLLDFLRLRGMGDQVGPHHGESPHGEEAAKAEKGLPAKLQSAKIPPLITFDHDLVPGGKRIPALFVAICGAVVGFVASIMGVGGGFLTFPMFVYILGVSSFTTVGTDVLQIIFTAGYAAVSQYVIYGFIFYTLAMGMLLGSLIGVQLGAMTTKVVKGIYIRGFYATAVLAGFINRLFALPKQLREMEILDVSKGTTDLISTIGNWVFFVVVAIFAIWVMSKFLGNIRVLRGEG